MPDRSGMRAETLAIRHDAAARRFEAVVEGHESHLSYADAGDGVLDFQHTFVPEELRGRGIASRLVAHALDHARSQGLKVIPTCPFVRNFMRRHPEYRDLEA
jgi:predicted GNAT family acetyltransferase